VKRTIVGRLILKDCYLHSPVVLSCIAGGVIALAILCRGGATPLVLGSVFFFMSMMFCACFLPMSNVVNERKKQTLPFLMSLPVSSVQYGVAKLVSTVGMFLAPWLILIAAGVWVITFRHALPNGAIPMGLILAMLPLVGFCLITGAALAGESEVWGIVALAVVNSSYWLVWYFLVTRFPDLVRDWTSVTAVWSPHVLMILGGEFAAAALILGLTLFIQSRKRDFI
jgi:ABC-2 type transport system permease protein